MKFVTKLVAAVVSTLFFAFQLQAAPINAPVPTSDYISYMGYDWAWAGPCDPFEPTCGAIDLSYQSTQGWRLPTAGEVASMMSSNLSAFVNAFNTGLGTNPYSPGWACASSWFNVYYSHCDVGDGQNGYIWNLGIYEGYGTLETFVIRGEGGPAPIPVPAAGFLLMIGLGSLALLRRRGSV